MKQRVATDERPFKTGSTDDSRTSDEEPAAALVSNHQTKILESTLYHYQLSNNNGQELRRIKTSFGYKSQRRQKKIKENNDVR